MVALKSHFGGRNGAAILGGCIMVLSTLLAAVTHADQAPAAGDETAARLIAAEMQQHAGQQGAVRVAAAHFADKLESHHYPAAPTDGVADGAQVAKAINGSLATYQNAVKNYRMDEKISVHGAVVTITSFTSGTFTDGKPFEDVSQVAYEVRDGKIARADAVHTNPGAIMKALRGSDDKAASDQQSAEKIAAEIRASGSPALDVAQKYYGDRVAAWSPAHADQNWLLQAETLRTQGGREMSATQQALANYRNREKVSVRGNQILVRMDITGTLANGEAATIDTDLALFVTGDQIVGLQASHSAQARATMRKILAASAPHK
jgi:ketosteroid isomerase-like protein